MRHVCERQEDSAISSGTTCAIELQPTSTPGKCSGKVEEMVLRVQHSGYNKKFRYEVVKTVLSRLTEQDKRLN